VTIPQSTERIAKEIRHEHELALSAAASALEHARRCGQLLAQAKEQLPHGAWAGWLADNFPASERMAQNYMRIAARWDELAAANPQRVSDLTIRGAVKLLAAPRADDNSAFVRSVERTAESTCRTLKDAEDFIRDTTAPTPENVRELKKVADAALSVQNAWAEKGSRWRREIGKLVEPKVVNSISSETNLPDAPKPASRFIPPPGKGLIILAGEYFCMIVPHTDPRYLFYGYTVPGIGGDACIEGNKKAIRADRIESVLPDRLKQADADFIVVDNSTKMGFFSERPMPWSYNACLYASHDEYMNEAILGKGCAA
jgi:hypothetical protein